MDDDELTEFCSKVGKEITCYGECQVCGDIFIRDPGNYNKPKMECDPDGIDDCKFWMPICHCDDDRLLYDLEMLEECSYPNCECGPKNG